MIQVNRLLGGSPYFFAVLRPSKYCVLSRAAKSSTTPPSRVSSIAENTLPQIAITKDESGEEYTSTLDGFFPDEDHPNYKIWIEQLEKMARTYKTQKIPAKQPAQTKLSSNKDPRYLELRRHVREIEDRLFEKCGIKREDQSDKKK